MQFSLVALLSLVAVAVASPIALPARLDDLTARQDSTDTPAVTAEAPAMSDANGNVVAFNSAGVYKAASAAGQ